MKRIRSWVIIVTMVLLSCYAVGCLFIGAWWNTVIIGCIISLVYAMHNEHKV